MCGCGVDSHYDCEDNFRSDGKWYCCCGYSIIRWQLAPYAIVAPHP